MKSELNKRCLAGLVAILIAASPLPASEPMPPLSPDTIKQFKELEQHARNMGSWSEEASVIRDAHELVFQRNGWDSESDLYTLELINEISDIAPWKTAERESVFLDGVQRRYDLDESQRTLVSTQMRAESMKVAFKHFKDVLPIALEVAQTRARREPFTPEQVQKWSKKLRPMMDDALQAVERVSQKLQTTMTPDQREVLETDMKAVTRRHNDVLKMVDEWQEGKWDPRDWGLDHDPAHSDVMAEIELANIRKQVIGGDDKTIAADADAWEQYVRWFCDHHQCDDTQRGKANKILKDSKKQAANHMLRYGKEIAKLERLSETAKHERVKKRHAERAQRLKSRIPQIFKQMCLRLERLLTTEQRAKANPAAKKKAAKAAAAETSKNK